MNDSGQWLFIINFRGTLDHMSSKSMAEGFDEFRRAEFTLLISTDVDRSVVEEYLRKAGIDKSDWPEIKEIVARNSAQSWLQLAGNTPPSHCIVLENNMDAIQAACGAGYPTVGTRMNTIFVMYGCELKDYLNGTGARHIRREWLRLQEKRLQAALNL